MTSPDLAEFERLVDEFSNRAIDFMPTWILWRNDKDTAAARAALLAWGRRVVEERDLATTEGNVEIMPCGRKSPLCNKDGSRRCWMNAGWCAEHCRPLSECDALATTETKT